MRSNDGRSYWCLRAMRHGKAFRKIQKRDGYLVSNEARGVSECALSALGGDDLQACSLTLSALGAPGSASVSRACPCGARTRYSQIKLYSNAAQISTR